MAKPARPRPKPKRANVKGYANRVSPLQQAGLPVDSQLLWTGLREPNPNYRPAGFSSLTPIKVGDQWQVYGVRTDPVGDAARPVLDQIDADKNRAQRWATEQVAPWAGAAFTNLAALNQTAQTGFANALGRGQANIGNLAGTTAPPAYAAGTEGLATPRAVETQAGQVRGVANAQAEADMGAYRGALSSLQMGATAQSQVAGLAGQIAQIPRAYDDRKNQFLQSLTNVKLQLEQSRAQRELARVQWNAEFGEGSRRFDIQTQQEAMLTGAKLEQDQSQFDANLAQDQSQFDANAAADQAKATQYTEKEARAEGGKGFWKNKPAKPPKGTSLVQASDTGRWIAIPAGGSGSGSSGGSSGSGAYGKLRADWAANAYEWLNPSESSTSDGTTTTKTKKPAKYKNGIAFFRSALAAGLNVQDAYDLLTENAPGNMKLPEPIDIFREIKRRNPKLNDSQVNSRVRQITGRYAPVGNIGP